MRKTYEIRGRNSLTIDDSHQGERYKTITFSGLTAPLSKPKVKELIQDLQKWLEEEE